MEVCHSMKKGSSSLKKDTSNGLGVKIELDGDFIKMLQPLLIERILRALDFHGSNATSKTTP